MLQMLKLSSYSTNLYHYIKIGDYLFQTLNYSGKKANLLLVLHNRKILKNGIWIKVNAIKKIKFYIGLNMIIKAIKK
jgi:exosome complex RNA-binding protein Rrp4